MISGEKVLEDAAVRRICHCERSKMAGEKGKRGKEIYFKDRDGVKLRYDNYVHR